MDAADRLEDTPVAAAAPRSRVSGIDRALQIIDHLLETGAPAGPYAIAKAIGAPVSTAYAIIDELTEKNLLSRRADGTVWLGARLHSYGLAYARSLDFLDAAGTEMQALCREVNETVQICGRDGDHMVVLAMAEGSGHFRVSSRVGTRVPLNWTASGRLLVGHLPEAERLEIFRRCARVSPTGRAQTDPAILAEEARATLADRLSVQIGASDFWIACVAAPIRGRDGTPLATISIVVPEQKLADGNRARFEAAVQAAAERVERALGAR
ncbi:MAG: IclR family transcriptional regulator [Devosia sp.]|jgi:DNA-binding IclR family transcriptional regulator